MQENTNTQANTIAQKSNPNKANPFAYFKPSDAMLPVIQETRNMYSILYKHLLTLPNSRERAVAITELETSAMWAIKGLVINDEGSTMTIA